MPQPEKRYAELSGLVSDSATDIICFTLTQLPLSRRSGSGAAMDIVVSSVRAYISALNKMLGFASAVKASKDTPRKHNISS